MKSLTLGLLFSTMVTAASAAPSQQTPATPAPVKEVPASPMSAQARALAGPPATTAPNAKVTAKAIAQATVGKFVEVGGKPGHPANRGSRRHSAHIPGSAATIVSANRAATREPTHFGYVNAVQVYPYSDGALYRLYAAPERGRSG
jgi:type IV secretion system protein TrbG